MLVFLEEAWKLSRKIKLEREEKKQIKAIAKCFNDRYAYKEQYTKSKDWLPHTGAKPETQTSNVRAGYAWMCPECNKIHAPLSWSVFSGLQYPRCCSFPEGHRLEY